MSGVDSVTVSAVLTYRSSTFAGVYLTDSHKKDCSVLKSGDCGCHDPKPAWPTHWLENMC